MTSYCHTCGKPTTKEHFGNLQVICEYCRQFICGVLQITYEDCDGDGVVK